MRSGRTRIVTGLHLVRKRRANGLWRHYVYAWRGGPCIHTQDGSKPVIGPELLAKAMEARRGKKDGNTFAGLIEAYKAAPEYTRLGERTKQDYRLWLDRIEEHFGDALLAAFDDQDMRTYVLSWRDQWSGQPRTADKASGTMATLLAWAVDRAILRINVAAGIRKLHKADRADLIWEERHWQAMADAPPLLMQALRLAALTGLRLGDLVRLDWSHVGPNSIAVDTRKRKARAVVPIHAELRSLLGEIGRGEGAVLKHSKGGAWTEDGIKTAFHRAKPEGFDRRIHDLRGTFVTFLCLRDFTDEQIARIVGWGAKRVADVRARYVDEARVVVALAERMKA